MDRLTARGNGGFFLRVSGDSMIDAGIFDGDLALVRPQAAADNGDAVVAMVDGEATLKHFFREADHIRLQPANPAMAPMIFINPLAGSPPFASTLMTSAPRSPSLIPATGPC